MCTFTCKQLQSLEREREREERERRGERERERERASTKDVANLVTCPFQSHASVCMCSGSLY